MIDARAALMGVVVLVWIAPVAGNALAQGKLVAPVKLEADWRDVGHAIDALLKRTISGKAVLHVDARG